MSHHQFFFLFKLLQMAFATAVPKNKPQAAKVETTVFKDIQDAIQQIQPATS